MANKNTIYTNALVNFLLDTKPYSRKLTEVNEIYQLNESMNVNVIDDLFSGVKIKPTWNYNFFSGGTGNSQPVKIQRISNYQDYGRYVNNQPPLSKGAYKVGRDESGSLLSIPLAYDPKSLTGVGLKDVYVQKNGDPLKQNYLVEGIDAFLSHGSYSFQIKQISGSNVVGTFIKVYSFSDGPFPIEIQLPFTADELILGGPCEQVSNDVISIVGPGEVRVYGIVESSNYNPRYQELKSDGVILAARNAAIDIALDGSNPASAISKINVIISAIDDQLSITPNADCQEQLVFIQIQLSGNKLPYSYETLINSLITNDITVIPDYDSWTDVAHELNKLSPRLLFNEFTDIGQYKTGLLRYSNLSNDQISIHSIVPNYDHLSYEEITIEALSATQLLVSGSESESLGVVSLGETFTSSVISFSIDGMGTPLNIGDKFVMTPSASITIGKNAITEQWNIIKVNPLAYSNPIFSSVRNSYARVVSQYGTSGQITFIDQNFPAGVLEFTAVSETQMVVSCESEPDYAPVITIGQAFNDGRLAFTVINGTSFPLRVSDRISMEVVNESPKAEDLGMYFGYDIDAYDANNLVYNNVSSAIENYLSTLDFGYDSRFINYDFETFNLVLSGAAVSNRTWRIRALANLDRPLLMPSRIVNLLGVNDPTNPSAAALYDSTDDVTSDGAWSATDPDSEDDLELWYADFFALEYQDGESGNWVQVRNDIAVGQRYNLIDTIGIAFTLAPALKPFIASRVTSSYFEDVVGPYATRVVEGGDTIQFTVVNPQPRLNPEAIVRSNAPRLIMYGDSYHNVTPALWTLTKTQTGYSLHGVYTSGANQGAFVYVSPLQLSVQDGLSFLIEEHNLHWTIIEGRGIEVGDSFNFETYSEYATYLVNGSVSGWQKPAVIGKWYWNGSIGFKINPAHVSVFYNDSYAIETATNKWSLDIGDVQISHLREDLESRIYEAVSTGISSWDLICNGCLIDGGSLNLEHRPFLKVSLPPAAEGTVIKIQIYGDDRHLSLGHDLVIINASAVNAPIVPDFVVIERIDHESLQIAIKTLNQDHLDSIAPLNPVTIDSRYFDAAESSATELPELGILSNWLPLQLRFKSPSGSETVFGNIASELSIRAISSDETVGNIKSLTSNLNDSVYLTWDSEFFEKYLPLNSETVIVPRLSGANENVSVRIAENINFLVSSSGLDESSLFNDNMLVEITEGVFLTVKLTHNEDVDVSVTDGPFTGFLPGFDNLPYDYELQIGGIDSEDGGYYDAGQPLVDMFYRARILAAKSELTPQEQLELNDSISALDPYLINGDVLSTSADDFISSLDLDDSVNSIPTLFGLGIPDNGIGIAITEKSASIASSNIIDMATIISAARGTHYDVKGYGVGLYDDISSATAYLTVSNNQYYYPFPINAKYLDFETELFTLADVNNVLLTFQNMPSADPEIYIWENSWTKAVLAAFEKPSSNEYLVSVPRSDELKIGIMPSPLELFANGEPGAWYDPSDLKLDWRYNLLTRTEEFDNATWTKTGLTVTANAIAAPDGTFTADKLIENTTASHVISQVATWNSGVRYVFSFFAKAAELTSVSVIDTTWSGVVLATFDLSNCTVTAAGPNTISSSASVSDIGNGWCLCSVSGTPVSSVTSAGFCRIRTSVVTGDDTSGIYIWGASLTTAANADKPYQKITDGVSDYFTYQPQPVLYQDAAGTTPVTAVEQPVGRMLDKSRGLVLGPELVVNGDFSDGTTGWNSAGTATPTFTVVGGVASLAFSTTGSGIITSPSTTVVAGKTYEIRLDVISSSTGAFIFRSAAGGLDGYNLSLGTTAGQKRWIVSPTVSGAISVGNTGSVPAGSSFSIDNISVRELPGAHAFQTTATSRPVLSARVNLLTKTEQFDDGVWGLFGGATKSGSTAATITFGSATNSELFQNTPNSSVPTVYLMRAEVRSATGKKFRFKISGSGTANYSADQQPTSDWQVFTHTSPAITTSSNNVSISNEFGGGGGSIEVRNIELVPANQSSLPYQRVNTATDYDAVGFPPYLKCDGVNDFMVSSNINFANTDKVTIIAGVGKQNNTASIIAELSANVSANAGSFALISGEELGGRYSSVSRGSAPLSTSQQAIFSDAGLAPDTAVISATHDISGDVSTIRRNVDNGSVAIGDKGTGNFGNYPLYLFRRGGTTMPFSGNLYSLIITGKQISQQQLLAYESWTNHRTFAIINPALIQEQVIGF